MPGRGAQHGADLRAQQRRAVETHAHRPPTHGRVLLLRLAQVVQHLVAADIERAEDHRPVARAADDGAVGFDLPLQLGQRARQHEEQLGAEQPDPVGARVAQMRHVDEQAGVHVQLDARLVLGDGGHVLERAVLALSAGEEADLVGIGGDHVGGRTQVNLARRARR